MGKSRRFSIECVSCAWNIASYISSSYIERVIVVCVVYGNMVENTRVLAGPSITRKKFGKEKRLLIYIAAYAKACGR